LGKNEAFWLASRLLDLATGRGERLKRSSVTIVILHPCLEEHLAAVPADMTVYIVGKEPEEARRYKCKLIKLAR
jgi:hypothetical protein